MPGTKGDRRGIAVAAGLLGFCVAASSGARAADDGYANVFSSVLGSVGLIKGDSSRRTSSTASGPRWCCRGTPRCRSR